jgi:hypothetical protein
LAPLSRRQQSAAAFATYALLSCSFLGLQLALHHDGRTYLGIKVDPQISIWAFGWWPHAILHGANPIVSHWIWAPDGVDLAWTTSVPGLALLFAPLTFLIGAFWSFNVAYMLMPALAAWTAYLLCRYLTHSFWPSFAGGYLFGFSSYVLGQLQGHIFLTAVFPLPLIALCVLRYLDGGLTKKGLALRLAPVVALQLLISTEVAFTATLALALSLLLAFAVAPARRRAIVSSLLTLVGAYALAAVLVAPFTWYWLTDFEHGRVNPASPDIFALDWLNLVAPTPVTGLGHWWTRSLDPRFTAGHAESGAYLGLPMVVIVVWFAWLYRKSAGGRFLPIALLLAAVLGSGTWLLVGGHRLITMPWEHIGYLPVFKNVLPARLSVYIALSAAVMAALWAASPAVPRLARAALLVAAACFLAPSVTIGWRTTVAEPAFIADGKYRQCVRKDENVAIFPFSRHGDSMLWQVDSGFWFRQAGGYVAPSPPDAFVSNPDIADIANFGTRSEQEVGPLLTLVREKGVDVVLVDANRSEPWRSLLAGVKAPKRVGDVLVYRFRGTNPAGCA